MSATDTTEGFPKAGLDPDKLWEHIRDIEKVRGVWPTELIGDIKNYTPEYVNKVLARQSRSTDVGISLIRAILGELETEPMAFSAVGGGIVHLLCSMAIAQADAKGLINMLGAIKSALPLLELKVGLLAAGLKGLNPKPPHS